MIVTPSDPPVEAISIGKNSWQDALRTALRSSQRLLSVLGLPPNLGSVAAEQDFPVFVPWEFVARMEPGNPADPLLRQVLATHDELLAVPGFTTDPVGDLNAQKRPGLLQKYHGRALLVTTGSCAVHCRYCFRRQYPYAHVPKTPVGWQPLLEEISTDASIEEIILSGGDPLMLADSSLSWLVRQINAIPHIRRLRIHTRMPVIIPQRIDDNVLRWIQSARPAIFWVLHINHANEMDDAVINAVRQLRATGATLLNQAVLLRGINDAPESQLSLCRRLIDAQIIPYYLHQLDRVQGAAHFEATVADGRRTIEYLRSYLPGYAVPQFVCERPGAASKTPL